MQASFQFHTLADLPSGKRPGFDSRRRLEIFLFTTASRTALGPTQPPIQWVQGALSLGVKLAGCEVDHSPPSSAEVKEWVELYLHSPNTPLWRGAQLKHRDNFILTHWIGGSVGPRATEKSLVLLGTVTFQFQFQFQKMFHKHFSCHCDDQLVLQRMGQENWDMWAWLAWKILPNYEHTQLRGRMMSSPRCKQSPTSAGWLPHNATKYCESSGATSGVNCWRLIVFHRLAADY
jgi:hypothetical protein